MWRAWWRDVTLRTLASASHASRTSQCIWPIAQRRRIEGSVGNSEAQPQAQYGTLPEPGRPLGKPTMGPFFTTTGLFTCNRFGFIVAVEGREDDLLSADLDEAVPGRGTSCGRVLLCASSESALLKNLFGCPISRRWRSCIIFARVSCDLSDFPADSRNCRTVFSAADAASSAYAAAIIRRFARA